MSHSPLRLLVAVINDPERLDQVLAGFVELGITGATVLESEGMGHMLAQRLPIFAGFQTLINGSRPENRIVMSVVRSDQVRTVVAVLEDTCGSLSESGTGIVFTLPVESVFGMAGELMAEDPSPSG